ncbi:MAG: excinuclease ABC subunit C, excinuclease ABC subunit C [Candidatus Gottesmanbacteria bacterium GW2011_GWA2_43_14]|uniref:Excinuclease ABC subunit C, excinuclease ABC subunit C n=1 Tax=Candidatus Gottesmanbacteria bacterium GW2011_GWA2_43_14 TaxID=1618443 RepID=A0A0G1DL69_9BACT|nr:MAG: excinuclease ABC subunit C, excinuclease ABC subunit C [Candidatus Gottesmanbacteria bacterium GW2011_GWA2_43_14]
MTNFSLSDLNRIPETTGVYLFQDKNRRIIYIGKAVNLKKRVQSYFRADFYDAKKKRLVENVSEISLIEVRNEFEALILEAKLIKQNQPKYNISLKDDKQYIYLIVTDDEYPRILLARKIDTQGELFGPFPSKKTVKVIIGLLRSIFPFCTQKPKSKRSCFYSHLGLCIPCPAAIRIMPKKEAQEAKKLYLGNIRRIKKILKGSIDQVSRELTQKMTELSRQNKYEEAAVIRDQLKKLEEITEVKFRPDQYMDNPYLAANLKQKEQQMLEESLSRVLNRKVKAETIECYDISNLSGQHATGSMVTFHLGWPDKKRYRHFRIKTMSTPDDYNMLHEVIVRRLRHSEWPLPDLFIVDGGENQLKVFLQVLQKLELNIPAIALAKRFEKIYYAASDGIGTLEFSRDTPALQLVQRLRDEAHRFAGRYHRLLRIKYLLNG